MFVLNASKVQTTPGSSAACPFAPPKGWKGGAEDYLKLMRERYAKDRMHSQRMVVIAWYARTNTIDVSGPFAKEAAVIIEKLKQPRQSESAVA